MGEGKRRTAGRGLHTSKAVWEGHGTLNSCGKATVAGGCWKKLERARPCRETRGIYRVMTQEDVGQPRPKSNYAKEQHN